MKFTDRNSGFFTQQITRERTIELAPSVASVGAATFAPVAMDAALRCLTTLVTAMRGRSPGSPGAPLPGALPPADRSDAEAPNRAEAHSQVEPLSQVALWSAVAEFLRPGDIVLADQGTAFYGMATHRLPRDVTLSGSRSERRSATPCRRCWGRASPGRATGASCWWVTEPRR